MILFLLLLLTAIADFLWVKCPRIAPSRLTLAPLTLAQAPVGAMVQPVEVQHKVEKALHRQGWRESNSTGITVSGVRQLKALD